MVKFVPVTDVERPKAAQNLNTSANDKHRRFDNPHSVGKTVDRGWQQGNVGWGVLGAFGNLDKDDAAQVIKRAEGVNKMVKNETGLWFKVKSAHTDAVSATSSSRGRGGGVSVLDSLGSNSNSSYEKPHSEDEGTTRQSRGRSDDRFRDKSEDRCHSQRRKPARDRSRSRNRSRSRCRSRSNSNNRIRRSRRRSRSREKRSHRSDHRRSDKHERERNGRSSSRSRSRSSSASRSRHRKRDVSKRDNDHRSHLPSGGRKRDRSSSSHADRKHSDSKHNESSRGSDTKQKSSAAEKMPNESSSSGTDITQGNKSQNKNNTGRSSAKRHDELLHEGEEELKDPPTAEVEEEQIFEFSATQLANRFLEVFSGLGLNIAKRSNTENEEATEELSDRRLDAIADLFSEDSQVLSLKSGKVMLSGKSSIRSSFTRTTPDESRCSHRIVLNIPADTASSDAYSNNEDSNGSAVDASKRKGSVSFCLDFHAPFTSPGLGDRTKDTALLYRCVGSLLTHIWGAVDPDKFSTAWPGKQFNVAASASKEAVLDTKCWAWALAVVSKEFPSFPSLVLDSEVVIFHDYNTIESWG